jgi:hypothetical protein
MGKEKPFLMFYDDCLHPDEKKGIHGDFDYVEFNRDCLDEAFLKAIPYLRTFRQRMLRRNNSPRK